MLAPRKGKLARAWCCEQPGDAIVELVVAVGGGLQAPGVLHVDGGHILQQAGVGRRSADVVARGEQEGGPGELGRFLVEHRRQLRRAADRHVAAIDRQRGLVELAVEVGQADDGHQRA